jgi:hypothetical protein
VRQHLIAPILQIAKWNADAGITCEGEVNQHDRGSVRGEEAGHRQTVSELITRVSGDPNTARITT